MPTPLVGTAPRAVTTSVNDYSDEALVKAYLRHYRDYSSRTLRERRRQLGHLSSWLGANTASVLADATEGNLIDFTDQVRGERDNVANHISAIRSFYRWLIYARVRVDNPAELLRRPRLPKRKPRPAPDNEVDLVLRSAALRSDELYAMLRLERFSGLRCSDIARLRVDWLRVEDGQLVADLTGKGDLQRAVPIDPETARVLVPFRTGPGPVFTRPSDGRGYTESRISQKLNAFIHGLGFGWSAHAIRHRAATALVAAGADPFELAKIMGWRSIRTAEIYTEVDMSGAAGHVIEAARRFNAKHRRRA